MTVPVDTLVIAATDLECRDLTAAFSSVTEVRAGAPRPVKIGRIGGQRVAVITAGVGKANAALTVAAAAGALAPALVLCLGVGGCYPESGLDVGDLAVATGEVYGDEGAEGSAGFLDLQELGLPLWEDAAGPNFGWFPVAPERSAALVAAAPAGIRVVEGVFVTVSTTSGSEATARTLRARTGGICESMEGAAAAQAALILGVPFAELRGISNRVGPRDRRAWQIERAAEVAQAAAVEFLRSRTENVPAGEKPKA